MTGRRTQNGLSMESHTCVLSCAWLFATLWTEAYQSPLSMAFLRQEYWSRLPFPSPGDLIDSGIEPASPALTGGFFTTEPPHGGDLIPKVWGGATKIDTISKIITIWELWQPDIERGWKHTHIPYTAEAILRRMGDIRSCYLFRTRSQSYSFSHVISSEWY